MLEFYKFRHFNKNKRDFLKHVRSRSFLISNKNLGEKGVKLETRTFKNIKRGDVFI